MQAQRVRHLDELPDAGGPGTIDPVVEEAGGAGLVRLAPEPAEILLEVVGRRQGRVELQGRREANDLVALGVQLPRVHEEPARALEHLLLFRLGLALELAPRGSGGSARTLKAGTPLEHEAAPGRVGARWGSFPMRILVEVGPSGRLRA